MGFYSKSKIMLRQLFGHELKAEVGLYCKTFSAGGWTFSPIGINNSSVIFSLGIADNIVFDKVMIDGFACNIHAFDPTPIWIDWIASQNMPHEFHFYPHAVGGFDGTLQLYPRVNKMGKPLPGMLTLIDEWGGAYAPIEAPVKRISTLMSEIGVDQIDILKMDIEASEYEVIDDILNSEVPVYQLLVEFHHRFRTVPLDRTKAIIDRLAAAGYRIFSISKKLYELSFIHEETYYQRLNDSLKGLTPRSGARKRA